MKKNISILLFFTFLLQVTSQLWIFVAFKINQDYIAANLCVNRFDVIPVCKGSCVLEDQLSKSQEQQELPDFKTKEVTLFCQNNTIGLPEQAIDLNSSVSYPLSNTIFITSDYLCSIFHPPDLIA